VRFYSLLFIPLLVAIGSAQEFRGTVTGQVLDPSGAAVVNARIEVRNRQTSAVSRTVSGVDGRYTVPFLVPGPYEVSAAASGFKKFTNTNVLLETAGSATININLQIGDASQSVEVSSGGELVDTQSASAGQVITTKETENLPVNGRNPLGLARYAYGVVPKEKHLLTEVRPFDTGAADFSLGGADSESNEYLLNGVPNMVNGSRVAAFSPLMDSVNEVRVDEFQSDASYGDTLGGTVNITTRGGTNQFHGSAVAFNETSALAANSFFLNAAGQPRSVTRQNEYGGTIGGPVLIPKVVNGRNKLFFFFAYEGFKDSTPATTTTAVPTAAERQGDFSALLPLGSSYQLYDPATGTLKGTSVTRNPFAGNMIPASRFNPIALKYLSYFPSPNQPGKSDGENNFIVNDPTIDNYVSYMGRADWNISERNKLFFELHTSNYTNSSADIFRNLASGQSSYLGLWGGAIDDVHTFSPTLILDTRLGFSRSYTTAAIKSDGFDPTQLGFPSYMLANSILPAMPRVSFSDALAGFSTSPGSIAPFDTLQLFVTGNKVVNRHFLKFGADIRRERGSSINPGYAAGTFTFGNTWVTAGTGAVSTPFGGSTASFLLGLPTAGQFDVNEPTTSSNYYRGFYLQDDWHITPTFTANLGMRLESETAVVESNNRQTVGFNPAAVNAVSQAAAAAYAAHPIAQLPAAAFSATGGLLFATPSNRSGYTTPAAFVSPRIGLSWAPAALHTKTVFRAGFGIFNNPFGAYNTGPATGFSQTTSLVPTNNSYLTPYASLSDPYPGGSIQQPPGSSQGVNTYLGNAITYYNPHLHDSYGVRYTFDIQQQLGHNFLLDIGYIGDHQVHLQNSNVISSSPLVSFLSRSPFRDAAATAALSAVVPNPFSGLLPGSTLNGSTTSVATLLNADPEFTSVTLKNIPDGHSLFSELVIHLTRRFANGLQFNVNYEFSRMLETYQLNAGEERLYTDPPSGDFPHHFVLAGTYELPFGKGAKFFNNANRVVNQLVGGWVLNSVYTWESGAVLSWGNVIYFGGNLNYQARNLGGAFNTSAFDINANDQPNSYNYRTFPGAFNNLRSDATNNADLSMLKNFRIKERAQLQYRFEAFNALNRPQFAAPNLSPTSKAFGTITALANTPRVIQMGLRLTF
jgi:hypothetical protein